jgi:hypothetical protein
MKKICSFVLMVLVFAALVSPVSAAEKEWTFMVFLNADNNLDEYGVGDQEEMAKVGSNDWLNVVSLIDREKGPATLNYIEKGKVVPVKEMGELDMGDYKQLVSFFKDVAKAYPAKRYALIVWNHGSGWKDASNNVIKGISYDDSTGNHITTEQIGLATKEIKSFLGRNLDVMAFDACLMQMIEVAYVMKDDCDYIMASQETEPGHGYPYDGILGGMNKGTTPLQFVKMAVKAYDDSYNNGSAGYSSTTQSAIDCAKIDMLMDAIDGFSKAGMAGNFAAQFKDALYKVQKFYYRTNIDLGDFAKILKGTVNDEGFQTAADKLLAAVNAAVVANGAHGSMKNATGVAVYFPASSYSFSALYNDLAFAKKSMWDEMVQDFYKKSTAASVVAELMNGSFDSLREYVATANDNNRDVSAHLVSKLNFHVFVEGGYDASTQETVKTLVQELKTK